VTNIEMDKFNQRSRSLFVDRKRKREAKISESNISQGPKGTESPRRTNLRGD